MFAYYGIQSSIFSLFLAILFWSWLSEKFIRIFFDRNYLFWKGIICGHFTKYRRFVLSNIADMIGMVWITVGEVSTELSDFDLDHDE